MALIYTTHGDLEESVLLKHDGGFENENERTTWVEYCLSSCVGQAHRTGTPDAPNCFCVQHVHRSVSVNLKQGLFAELFPGGFA